MASVLIVDDDADIRGLLREVLERAGHTVIEAGDGREGLRVFHAEKPQLVILDVSKYFASSVQRRPSPIILSRPRCGLAQFNLRADFLDLCSLLFKSRRESRDFLL